MKIETVSDEFVNRAKRADVLAIQAMRENAFMTATTYEQVYCVYWQEAFKALSGKE